MELVAWNILAFGEQVVSRNNGVFLLCKKKNDAGARSSKKKSFLQGYI